MEIFRLTDLRGRLMLVVFLALLPVLGLLLRSNHEMRNLQRAHAESTVWSVVRDVVRDHERRLESARSLLAALAEAPELAAGPDACAGYLARLPIQNQRYVDLVVVGPDGTESCRAADLSRPLDATEIALLGRARSEGAFVAGPYGRIPGSTRPVQRVAFAAEDTPGGPALLAWLELDLPDSDETLADGTVLAIDLGGRVFARHPDPERWIGRRMPEAPLVRQILDLRTSGQVESPGLDGIQRLYAFAPLPSSGGSPVAYFTVGVPTAPVFAQSRSSLVRDLIGLAIVLLLAGTAVAVGGRALILRHVHGLVGSMRRFAQGDHDARAPVRSRDEIGELARAFNEMADDLSASHSELERRVEERTGELHVAAMEAEERQRILEALLESLPVGVFVVRAPTGEPVLLNRAGEQILGRPTDPARGSEGYSETYAIEREDGSPYPTDEVPVAITLRTGRPETRSDMWVRRPDGGRVAIRASSAPIFGPNGRLSQAVAVFEDTTRERELDRAKDEFVGLASHQLRTPASGVKAWLSMLLDGDAGELTEDQAEFVARAYESNDHGLHLIEDLLAVTRIESGRYRVRLGPVDMAALAERVVEEQRRTIERRDQRVAVRRPAEAVVAAADEAKIRMAIANLVDNASKYTPRGGDLEVAVAAASGRVEVAVRDSGVGISEEDRGRLFQRFSRIERRETAEVAGTGLGLYLVKQIVDLHDGTIEVESEAGAGTTFTIGLRRIE